MDYGDVPGWISAISSALTLMVAVIAAVAAFRQVREARTLRLEQAQPFVVLDIETSGTGHPHTDLVIRNIGQTLAYDVRLKFSPELQSTMDEDNTLGPLADASIFKRGIPSMPPGREYRMLFEDMPARYESDLTRQYDLEISYFNSRGEQETLKQVLDLDAFYGYGTVRVHDTHHIAKTLRAWAKSAGVRNF
ncbi:hypothetical protein [Streptomyces eurythermus]|uniref:hypothetical protein n=1 Tax=Streptomyces eurythermus TaxID=42237 RepID=UPI0033E38430